MAPVNRLQPAWPTKNTSAACLISDGENHSKDQPELLLGKTLSDNQATINLWDSHRVKGKWGEFFFSPCIPYSARCDKSLYFQFPFRTLRLLSQHIISKACDPLVTGQTQHMQMTWLGWGGNYKAVVLNAVKHEAGTFYCPLEVESSKEKLIHLSIMGKTGNRFPIYGLMLGARLFVFSSCQYFKAMSSVLILNFNKYLPLLFAIFSGYGTKNFWWRNWLWLTDPASSFLSLQYSRSSQMRLRLFRVFGTWWCWLWVFVHLFFFFFCLSFYFFCSRGPHSLFTHFLAF